MVSRDLSRLKTSCTTMLCGKEPNVNACTKFEKGHCWSTVCFSHAFQKSSWTCYDKLEHHTIPWMTSDQTTEMYLSSLRSVSFVLRHLSHLSYSRIKTCHNSIHCSVILETVTEITFFQKFSLWPENLMMLARWTKKGHCFKTVRFGQLSVWGIPMQPWFVLCGNVLGLLCGWF